MNFGMTENIKFNVIIPTRERADTLYHCLRTVIAQDYKNLTIIVSDNFSQDNTKEVVYSFADPRIKYLNTGKRISMSHNWEFALGHVTGGWVTIVGDDDGLLPDALITVAEAIQKTGCQAITSVGCYYSWPNSIAGNRLIVPITSGIELRNGREWLKKLMCGDAVYQDMPCLYTGGFIDYSAINRARDKSGTFFLSMNPDIYSGIALASVLDNYVMLNAPVAIGGTSSHSNGASAYGIGASLAPVNKFLSEGNIPFHSMLAGGEIPKSLQILVYESYLQSVHLHNDFLKVKLEEQLGLALSNAELHHHPQVREYCSRVALKNSLDFDFITREYRNMKGKLFLHRIKGVIRGFKQLAIQGKDLGIYDVYGASLAAKAIYLVETRYTHWRLDNLFRLLIKLGGRRVR